MQHLLPLLIGKPVAQRTDKLVIAVNRLTDELQRYNDSDEGGAE